MYSWNAKELKLLDVASCFVSFCAARDVDWKDPEELVTHMTSLLDIEASITQIYEDADLYPLFSDTERLLQFG